MFPLLPALLGLGCAVVAPPPPAPPPEDSMDDVLVRLEEAALLATTDREGALEVWNTARWKFEHEVEPGLRATRDPLDVTATEYTFARIHRSIEAGKDATDEIGILSRRLRPPRLAHR